LLGKELLALASQPFGGEGVNCVRLGAQDVTGGRRGQDGPPVVAAGLRGQSAPQPRDVEGDGLRTAPGRGIAPQLINDAIGGEWLVGMEDEQREQGALPGRRVGHRPAVLDGLEGAEDSELHRLEPDPWAGA